MMRRRVLGVGELASAGCSATCKLTKRLVIRINIFGRHIVCAAATGAMLPRWPFAVCRRLFQSITRNPQVLKRTLEQTAHNDVWPRDSTILIYLKNILIY